VAGARCAAERSSGDLDPDGHGDHPGVLCAAPGPAPLVARPVPPALEAPLEVVEGAVPGGEGAVDPGGRTLDGVPPAVVARVGQAQVEGVIAQGRTGRADHVPRVTRDDAGGRTGNDPRKEADEGCPRRFGQRGASLDAEPGRHAAPHVVRRVVRSRGRFMTSPVACMPTVPGGALLVLLAFVLALSVIVIRWWGRSSLAEVSCSRGAERWSSRRWSGPRRRRKRRPRGGGSTEGRP